MNPISETGVKQVSLSFAFNSEKKKKRLLKCSHSWGFFLMLKYCVSSQSLFSQTELNWENVKPKPLQPGLWWKSGFFASCFSEYPITEYCQAFESAAPVDGSQEQQLARAADSPVPRHGDEQQQEKLHPSRSGQTHHQHRLCHQVCHWWWELPGKA